MQSVASVQIGTTWPVDIKVQALQYRFPGLQTILFKIPGATTHTKAYLRRNEAGNFGDMSLEYADLIESPIHYLSDPVFGLAG